MSWILMLLKNLPAIMAAIQTLLAIFGAKAAYANHVAYAAKTVSEKALAEADWNLYVAGQGGGVALLAVGAIAAACAQPVLNRVFAAFAREQQAEQVALSQILVERDGAAQAFALRAQVQRLAPEHQAIVIGPR